MNDEALCDFMTRHRLPGGNYELPVDDWEKLSEADRLHLAERLKVQRHIPNHQTWTYSMPCAVLDGNGDSGPDTRFADVSERNTLDFDPEIEKTGHGRESYQSLIKADGRPLYAIDLLQEVLDNPEAFIDMLRPWLNSSTGDRPESSKKRISFESYIKEAGLKRVAEIEKDPSCLQSGWKLQQSIRRRQRRLCRERGCNGFEEYTSAVRRRLASHGFSQNFDLSVDPGKQDKLTTWIEYLNCECWWLDQYQSTIERLQPAYDEAWQELLSLNILRPHETEKFPRTLESPLERGSEEEEAYQNVAHARARARDVFVLTQEDPDRTKIPKQKRIAMLQTSTKSILDAEKRAHDIRTRNDHITIFIRATSECVDARKNAARHTELVWWVRDLVEVVRSETIGQTKRAANGSRCGRGIQKQVLDPIGARSKAGTKSIGGAMSCLLRAACS
ncbi:hypothetical protein CSOJ01_14735 [Colletotrichum sojae]|uniref:Uncharacterized protein n=1 Tax=Colletotrichum sojae TaxID=2175907 RepID=A0A8H6IPB1_9PEZI|nr:hypothetical protein CSOJ01_14735 [Colletotrichum sojae]